MYCENCGHKIPEDADFCPNCGHNLKHYTSSLYSLKNRWNQLSGDKKTLTVLAICVFCLILINGSVLSSISHQDESVQDYGDTYSYSTYDDVDDSDEESSTTLVSQESAPSESSYSSDSSDSNDYSQTYDSSDEYGGSDSGGSYVGSVNSDKFHYPSCSYANRIKSSNIITFSSRDDALSSGYSPCKSCCP